MDSNIELEREVPTEEKKLMNYMGVNILTDSRFELELSWQKEENK